ncbi:MAG: hypothetical protein ACFFBP_05350 [Promethearchaeota archaeon]
MSESKAGIIILGIVAIASLGLSGYMFLTNEIFVSPDNQNIVVGMWDNLDENMDFADYNETNKFLIELKDQKIINNNYISISNANTTIWLLKPGLYKISCIIDLTNLGDTDLYRGQIIEDSTIYEDVFYFFHPASPTSDFYQVITTFYILTDGTHLYRFKIYSPDDTDFGISDSVSYNQFIIEYVRY